MKKQKSRKVSNNAAVNLNKKWLTESSHTRASLATLGATSWVDGGQFEPRPNLVLYT